VSQLSNGIGVWGLQTESSQQNVHRRKMVEVVVSLNFKVPNAISAPFKDYEHQSFFLVTVERLTDLGKVLKINFSGFAGNALRNKLKPPGVRKSRAS
jgi:hypothetical protein